MKVAKIPHQLLKVPTEIVVKDKFQPNLVATVKQTMQENDIDEDAIINPFLNDEDVKLVSGDDVPEPLQRTVINLYFRRLFSVLDGKEALLACACLREHSEMYTSDWINMFKQRIIPVLKQIQ